MKSVCHSSRFRFNNLSTLWVSFLKEPTFTFCWMNDHSNFSHEPIEVDASPYASQSSNLTQEDLLENDVESTQCASLSDAENEHLAKVRQLDAISQSHRKGPPELYCDNCIKYNVPPISRVKHCLQHNDVGECDLSVSLILRDSVNIIHERLFPWISFTCQAVSAFNWCARRCVGRRSFLWIALISVIRHFWGPYASPLQSF